MATDPELGWLTMVVATVPPEALEQATRVYPAERDGVIYQRERAFGLNEEYLQLLRLCQTPQTVVDLALRLGQTQADHGPPPGAEPPVDLAEHLEPRSMAAVAGLGGLPIGLVRALLAGLFDKELVQVEPARPDAELADPATYRAILDGLRAL